MLFLHCTKERGYAVHIAEFVAKYGNVSSSNLPTASFDFVSLDKHSDRLCVYNHLDIRTKESMLEGRLSSRGDSCCFVDWHCVELCVVSLLVHSRTRIVALL